MADFGEGQVNSGVGAALSETTGLRGVSDLLIGEMGGAGVGLEQPTAVSNSNASSAIGNRLTDQGLCMKFILRSRE